MEAIIVISDHPDPMAKLPCYYQIRSDASEIKIEELSCESMDVQIFVTVLQLAYTIAFNSTDYYINNKAMLFKYSIPCNVNRGVL